ncbi:hypothetical protein CK203_058813 [Vitis vinifera]|uniref:Uncharacterized protein n=1 Tax=Vitis vinifera TaxID=29760 RepID=A0A438GGC4_VITVI|nr:hypothetical protein CK203_058813 [Vitis vinifera]
MLLQFISQTDQLKATLFYKFSSYDHYEASSAKHWITSTLFLQGLNLLFTACFHWGELPWEIRNGKITASEWVGDTAMDRRRRPQAH